MTPSSAVAVVRRVPNNPLCVSACKPFGPGVNESRHVAPARAVRCQFALIILGSGSKTLYN